MFISRPDKRTKPNGTTTNRVTGAWTQHAGRGRVLARHAQGRAPRDEFAMTTGNHQPRSGLDIGIGKVAYCSRIQIVGWIVDNIFWLHTVIGGNPAQAFALLPFMISSIDGQDV